MKILFLGDSITEGVGASSIEKRYTDLVGANLACQTVNYGISGTRIARQRQTSYKTIWDIDFRTRLPLMESEADIVFVFGGTNDYGHGALHLGKPHEKREDTFCTQLHFLLNDLIKKYGKDKLCFILPLHRFSEEPVQCKGKLVNELGASLGEYVEAMRIIVSDYGIDFIDLYNNGFAKPMSDLGDEYTVDGLHPNDRGYEVISNRVCEYVLSRTKTSK